jgi:trigger factor
MQISVESNGALEKTLKVTLPEEKVTGEVENRLKSLTRTTRIQGFRPGKVPYKVVKQRFGSRVRDEVVGELIQSSFQEAVVQENLRPAGTPEIGSLEAETGNGIVYTAKFEVFPDFELTPCEQLEIEKPVCEVTDADIDKMLEVLREQRKTLQDVDREAAGNDVVNIDFTGFSEEKEFTGGAQTNFNVDLGNRRMIDGFEDGLVGKKAGDEFILHLKFPDKYHNEELAGKPARFSIKINRVQEGVLPDINEDFLEQFGVKEGGIEELRTQIREHMEREKDQAVKGRIRDAVMDALYDANKVELPNTLVTREQHRMKAQFESNLKAQGLPADQFHQDGDDTVFSEEARKRVALQLVVAELIKSNDLKADAAKVRAIIESNAANYQDPAAIINWYYADRNRLAEIEAIALEEAVVDLVTSRAGTKDVKLTFDECTNKRQTGSA